MSGAVHRMTPFMEKETRLEAEASLEIIEDAEVRPHWQRYASAVIVRERLGLDTGEESATLRTLLDRIKDRLPKLEHAFGEHLPVWLRYFTLVIMAQAAQDPRDREACERAQVAAMPTQIERFLPDNPITITTDPATGKPILADVEGATPAHFMRIASYFRSLKPARPVGRPKGPAKPPESGKPPVNPELALRVYQCTLDGMKWQEIAPKVLHTPIPSDPKARENLRGRIRYCAAVGARLYRKKSGK